jgi:hypothetical protein
MAKRQCPVFLSAAGWVNLVTPFWISSSNPLLRLAEAQVKRLPTPDLVAKMSNGLGLIWKT